jgi:MFS family permease
VSGVERRRGGTLANMRQERHGSPAAILAVVLCGLFMVPLDVTIVNVATPSIESDLGTSSSQLVFVVAGYTLAYASLLVASARWGNEHGHRSAFCTGLALFGLGSLACGVAPDPTALIAARVLQGVGGALISPQVLSVIQLQLPPGRRASAFGLYGTVLAGGAVSGQLLGGALVSSAALGLGWRSIFLVNVPVALALVPIAWRVLADTRAGESRPIDLPGTLGMSSGVLLLVLASVLGLESGWPAWSFGLLASGIVVLAACAAYLRRLPPGRGVIDFSIMRERSVVGGLSCIFLATTAYGGFLFTLGLYLQDSHGFDALRSGLAFAPFAAGFAAASLGFSRLPLALRDRAPTAGLALSAVAYAVLALLVGGGDWHSIAAAIVMAVAGGGYGLGFSPIFARVVDRVPVTSASDASGALTTINQLGFVAGVATFGSWFLVGDHWSSPADAGRALGYVYAGLAVISALAAIGGQVSAGETVGAAPVAEERSVV